jgi:hypothetical protein
LAPARKPSDPPFGTYNTISKVEGGALREKAKTQKPLSSIIERVLLKGARPFVAIKQHKEIDFHDVCAGPVLGSENRADRGDKLQAGDVTGLRLVPLICCVQRARFWAPKVAYFSTRLERSPLLLPPLLLSMLLQ